MGKPSAAEIEKIISRPYTIELEYGATPEEGVAAYVVEWPGCITAGETREEALSHIADAMRDWAEYRTEKRYDIPAPMREFGGTVVVKMPRTLHRDVAKRAKHEGVSMNQWIATTIARAVGTPSVRRPETRDSVVGGMSHTRKARRRALPRAAKRAAS